MASGGYKLLPWVYSLLLHAGFLLLLVLSIHWTNSELPALGGNRPDARPVQATVVDQALIQQQMAMLQAEEQKKRAERQKLQQQAAAAKLAREQEEQRLAQLKAEQQQAQQALDQKLAELQKQAQAEQARLAKLKAQAAEEARKRKSAESARRRAQLQAEIAAEEKARHARLASLLQQWIALVKQKVQNNWNEPATTPPNLSCQVQVEQVPGGTVANVRVLSCNGDDAVRQSIITAVYRASPLPPPPDPSLFQRELVFTFKPQNRPGN